MMLESIPGMSVLGTVRQLFPPIGCLERGPSLLPFRDASVRNDVGELGHPLAYQYVREKHVLKTSVTEDLALAIVKHVDFQPVVGLVGAFVAPHFENARLFLRRGRRQRELRPRLKGLH